MILHGKAKGTLEDDTELTKTLKSIYANLNYENCLKLITLIPDDPIPYSIISLTADLNLTSIFSNIKSYTAWHKRRFLKTDIKKEEELIMACLSVDPRNFHCWNYARYLKVNVGYLIFQADYKNYSAAHEILQNEQINVIDLIYTDPNDEGLWKIYQCNKKLKMEDYFIVYKNYFICCSKLSVLYIRVNNVNYTVERIGRYKYLINVVLNSKDTIILNDKTYIVENPHSKCEEFVNEICELDEGCIFSLLEVLRFTDDENQRNVIIKRLCDIDVQRREYYLSLIDEYYYIVM